MPIEIVLDDFIPVRNGRPAFSQGHGSEIWVILLEKAWAKIHGSYERIEGGQAHHTMRDITGAPSFEYEIEKTPDMFNKLVEAEQFNFIMTAGCDADNEAQAMMLREIGLIAEHSYAILKAVEITDKNGQ